MNRNRRRTAVEPLESRLLMAAVSVLNTNDSGAGSLRDAIANAAPGDTINFATTGTITLQSTLNVTQDLTLDGAAESNVTIDGGTSVQLFTTNGGTLTLENLTLTNGNAGINKQRCPWTLACRTAM